MLRCLAVLLALVLLLGGCAQDTTEPPAPTENLTQNTPNPGIYIAESAVEQATQGAIRAFRIGAGTDYDCIMLGQQLLLMYRDGEDTVLTLYQGDTLTPVREFRMLQSVLPKAEALQVNEQGFGYFDAASRSVIFLNNDLVVIGQADLPETLQGDAWLTPDWKSVYYCTSEGVFVMDLQTGISRLLREESAPWQEITGGFGRGECIRWAVRREDGSEQTILLDGKTGQTLREGSEFACLVTRGEQYFMSYNDRGVDMLRFGNGQEHKMLWPEEAYSYVQMLFANNAIVTVLQEWEGSHLSYYDLQTGQRKASITLDGISQLWSIRDDGKGGIWFFAGNSTGGRWLYHWNCEKSLTLDETDYIAPYYTAASPDTEGMAQLEEKFGELEEKFGIDIVFGGMALEFAPENYVFTAEHMVQIYEQYLPQLEELLSVFPKEIFSRGSAVPLKLVLTRAITGDVLLGTLPSRGSMQFWNGNTPVAVVTLGDNFAYELLRSVYLYMETRLLSKSDDLYEWYRQNPAEFDYDDDYVDNLYRTDTTYLEGENPYFIDLFSMSFAREDRATIFAYGCLAEGEEYFTTPILQKKLKRICTGIREAFGLKKVTTEFLWEQYKA